MILKLNLLENSHDYVSSSLDLYKEADEFGMHDIERSSFDKKVKWKLSFVTMVQATELLFKEILRRIHPNLIYENIDLEQIDNAKTVSFHQAISRINNMSDKTILEKEFLLNCSKLRNQFIHYEVSISSEEIKSKYCLLFSIYLDIHKNYLDEEMSYHKARHKSDVFEILLFNKDYTVFRGRDIKKVDLEALKKEIAENELYHFYITKDGEKVKRIRYGEEREYFENHVPNYKYYEEESRNNFINNTNAHSYSFYDEYLICDDCLAKRGEYHLDNCDLEVCPVCGGQLITCGCIDEMVME